jgi:regulator of sigma D
MNENLDQAVQGINEWAESVGEIMQRFAIAVNEFGTQIAVTIKPIFDQMQPFFQQIYDYYHDAYIQSGACYGDTPEGFERWFRELGEVVRLRAEAEDILIRQRQDAYAREMGRQLGAKILERQANEQRG